VTANTNRQKSAQVRKTFPTRQKLSSRERHTLAGTKNVLIGFTTRQEKIRPGKGTQTLAGKKTRPVGDFPQQAKKSIAQAGNTHPSRQKQIAQMGITTHPGKRKNAQIGCTH